MISATLPGGWIRIVLWRHLLSVKSPESFVTQVGCCEMNEAGDIRERAGCLVAEADECHSSLSLTQRLYEELCKSFKPGLLFLFMNKWKLQPDLPIAQIQISVPLWISLLRPYVFWPSCFALALVSPLESWVPSSSRDCVRTLAITLQVLWDLQSSWVLKITQDRAEMSNEGWRYRPWATTNGGPYSSLTLWCFPRFWELNNIKLYSH